MKGYLIRETAEMAVSFSFKLKITTCKWIQLLVL